MIATLIDVIVANVGNVCFSIIIPSLDCNFGSIVYLEVQHPCLSCKFSSLSANASAGVRWPSTRMGRLSVSSTISRSPLAIPGSIRAFGQAAADDAVAVLVAAPPPGTVGVGEARVHARPVAQPGVAGEPGAVVVRDADARAGRRRGEHRRLRPDARACGFLLGSVGLSEMAVNAFAVVFGLLCMFTSGMALPPPRYDAQTDDHGRQTAARMVAVHVHRQCVRA